MWSLQNGGNKPNKPPPTSFRQAQLARQGGGFWNCDLGNTPHKSQLAAPSPWRGRGRGFLIPQHE